MGDDVVEIVPALSDAERVELAECEQTIAHGLRSFADVGNALAHVRDVRLYRETHATFEAYLDERWGMKRQRGYQLIDAADVVERVSKVFDTTPTSDSVARELVPVLRSDAPERVVDVWSASVERHGPKPTAAQVREVRTELVPAPRKQREARSDERRRRERRDKFTEHLRAAASQLRVASTMVDDEIDDLLHLTDPALEGWIDLVRRIDESSTRITHALTGATP
jgi:hypothetical protein